MQSILARQSSYLRVPPATISYWHLSSSFHTSRPINKKKRQGGRPAYRFVDKIRLRAVAGLGGKGCLSMQGLKQGHKKRPDGGHGGRGGHVILVADPKKQTLRLSHHVIVAEKGEMGSSKQQNGRAGKNKIIRVPCGVVVRKILEYNEELDPTSGTVIRLEDEVDQHVDDRGYGNNYGFELPEFYEDVDLFEADQNDLNDTFNYKRDDNLTPLPNVISYDDETTLEKESRQKVVLSDLDTPGSWLVVARGGHPGRGNCDFAKMNGPPPDPMFQMDRAKPGEGETAYLELELKLIADVGLVGFPNAGKSSLLAAMSRATPEIAPYPFTTLHPFVGVIEYRDGIKVRVADVPGLVEGASEGRGRGHDFLRHIERNKALLYIVDSAGCDGRDPLEDLKILAQELSSYDNGDLLSMPALVVANKVDLLSANQQRELLIDLGNVAKELGIRSSSEVVGISAGVSGEGLAVLSRTIREMVINTS